MGKAYMHGPAKKTGLTLTFGDKKKNLSVEALRNALENALVMLQSLESDFVSADTLVRWEVVKVRMQSPLSITFSPSVNAKGGRVTERKMVKAAAYDLRAIERNGVAPKHFNEEGLLAVQKLVAVAKKEDTPIAFAIDNEERLSLTEKSSKRVNELVDKARLYVDVSTIEGKLETISVHGGTSFIVWESFTNNKVECRVSKDQFEKWSQYLGKRVSLTGRVAYRNHIPKSITVDEIRVLRGSSELPEPKDIGPVDITGGMKSEDYIRSIRNG